MDLSYLWLKPYLDILSAASRLTKIFWGVSRPETPRQEPAASSPDNDTPFLAGAGEVHSWETHNRAEDKEAKPLGRKSPEEKDLESLIEDFVRSPVILSDPPTLIIL